MFAAPDITAFANPSSAKETPKALCQAMNSGSRQSWEKCDSGRGIETG
jgi:hypothetical protein